jgi:hypothetical protein
MMFAPRPSAHLPSFGNNNLQDHLRGLQDDPELAHVFQDIRRQGVDATLKHLQNDDLMLMISKKMGNVPVPFVIPHSEASKPVLKANQANNIDTTAWKVPTGQGRGESGMRRDGVPQGVLTCLPPGLPCPPGLSLGLPQSLKAFGTPPPPDASKASPDTLTAVEGIEDSTTRVRHDIPQGQLRALQEDPELAHVFQDIRKYGHEAARKHYQDADLMLKISRKLGGAQNQSLSLPATAPRTHLKGPRGGLPYADGPTTDHLGQGSASQDGTLSPSSGGELSGTDSIPSQGNSSSGEASEQPKSIGSIGHPNSCTSECLFYFFRGGCRADRDCLYCHEFHSRQNVKKNRRHLKRFGGTPVGVPRESQANEALLKIMQNDPELTDVFKDIKKNGMQALLKHYDNDDLMRKIGHSLPRD